MIEAALLGPTVLEVGSFITVPYFCKLLADLGAEVIKIEEPVKGGCGASPRALPRYYSLMQERVIA